MLQKFIATHLLQASVRRSSAGVSQVPKPSVSSLLEILSLDVHCSLLSSATTR